MTGTVTDAAIEAARLSIKDWQAVNGYVGGVDLSTKTALIEGILRCAHLSAPAAGLSEDKAELVEPLIGNTGWCGHSMMKSLCPICTPALTEEERLLLAIIGRLDAAPAVMCSALEKIANRENYGSDGGWNAESYPDEIARAALAAALSLPTTIKAFPASEYDGLGRCGECRTVHPPDKDCPTYGDGIEAAANVAAVCHDNSGGIQFELGRATGHEESVAAIRALAPKAGMKGTET